MPVTKSQFDSSAQASLAVGLVAQIEPLLDTQIALGNTTDVPIAIAVESGLIGFVAARLDADYQAVGWSGVNVGRNEFTNGITVTVF